MSAKLPVILAWMLTAGVTSDAAAQWNVARFDGPANRIYTAVGLEPALVASVGYGRLVPVLGHRVQLSGEVGLGVAELDTHDFRARFSGVTSIVRWRSLRLTGAASFITRGTENSIYRGLNLGADVTGTLGAYRRTWFVAAEFGFDKAVVTHVTHTGWYRRYFYPDARDGWYRDAGGAFRYGLSGGFAIGRAEAFARAGWRRTEDFNELIPPLYAVLGLGFAF